MQLLGHRREVPQIPELDIHRPRTRLDARQGEDTLLGTTGLDSTHRPSSRPGSVTCGDTPGLSAAGPHLLDVTAAPQFTFRPSADSCRRADGGRMKIVVLGVGHIGSAIGRLWHSAGHETMFAGREKREPRDLAVELG